VFPEFPQKFPTAKSYNGTELSELGLEISISFQSTYTYKTCHPAQTYLMTMSIQTHHTDNVSPLFEVSGRACARQAASITP